MRDLRLGAPGDMARAQELQKLLAAPSAILGAKYGISGLKYALDQLGYFGGPVRGPLLPLDDAGKREIDAMLAAMNCGIGSRGGCGWWREFRCAALKRAATKPLLKSLRGSIKVNVGLLASFALVYHPFLHGVSLSSACLAASYH